MSTDAPVELDIVQETPTLDVVADVAVDVTQPPDNTVEVLDAPTTVDTTTPDNVVELAESPVELEIAAVGPAGRPGTDGKDGAPGAQGPPGSLDNASYIWTQNDSDTVWVIPHGLGFHPSVTVVDSGGTAVEGGVQHLDIDTVVVTFEHAFGGVAYLS